MDDVEHEDVEVAFNIGFVNHDNCLCQGCCFTWHLSVI